MRKTTLLLALGLSACGVGHDTETTETFSASPETIRLNRSNAALAAMTTYQSVVGLMQLADPGNLLPARDPEAPRPSFDLSGFVRRRMLDVVRRTQTGAAIITDRKVCGSGTRTEIWHDVDNDGTVSDRDTFQMRLDGCTENDVRLSGAVQLDNLSVQGAAAGDKFSLGLRMTIELVVGAGPLSLTLSGQIAATMAVDNQQETLRYEFTQPFETTVATILPNTVVSRQVDRHTNAFSVVARGNLRSPLIGGTIAYQTVGALNGPDADETPSAGAMLLLGADSTSVLMNAVDGDNVQLLIDSDGDQTYETDMALRWKDLGG